MSSITAASMSICSVQVQSVAPRDQRSEVRPPPGDKGEQRSEAHRPQSDKGERRSAASRQHGDKSGQRSERERRESEVPEEEEGRKDPAEAKHEDAQARRMRYALELSVIRYVKGADLYALKTRIS